jgi:hypothetical protein
MRVVTGDESNGSSFSLEAMSSTCDDNRRAFLAKRCFHISQAMSSTCGDNRHACLAMRLIFHIVFSLDVNYRVA